MATTKKKVEVKKVKIAKHRTVYRYWPDKTIDDYMLCDLLNSFYDNEEDAKQEAISDGANEAYLYKVTVTRIAKGSKPPLTWTKE